MNFAHLNILNTLLITENVIIRDIEVRFWCDRANLNNIHLNFYIKEGYYVKKKTPVMKPFLKKWGQRTQVFLIRADH